MRLSIPIFIPTTFWSRTQYYQYKCLVCGYKTEIWDSPELVHKEILKHNLLAHNES